MHQSNGAASAVTARRGLPRLRPLLLLGGFVLAWWLLMTGAAQADEGAHGTERGLGTAAKALTGKVDASVKKASSHQRATGQAAHRPAPRAEHPAPVRETAKSVRKVVEPVAAPVRKTVDTTVRATTKTVTTTVTRTVRSAPVKPVVSTLDEVTRQTRDQLEPLTAAVRAEVRDVLVHTTAALPPALVEPVLDTADAQPLSVDAAGSTSTVVDASGAQSLVPASNETHRLPAGAVEHAAHAVPDELSDLVLNTDAATDPTATPSNPADDRPASGVLVQHGVSGAGSAGSGSAPAPGAGVLAAGAQLMIPSGHTVRSTDSDRRPAGPAYRPSCSPD